MGKIGKRTGIILVGMVLVVSICGAYGISHVLSSKRTDNILSEIQENTTLSEEITNQNIKENNGLKVQNGVKTHTAENQWGDEIEYLSCDFSTVDKYKDVVGWISYESCGINFPVVQCTDNEKYLSTSLDGAYSIDGWIFADYRDDMENMSSKNIVIYGHNMLDGSMFGGLEKVLEKGYFDNEDNYYILYNSKSNRYVYKIYGVYVSDLNFNFIQTDFSTESEFNNYILETKRRTEAQNVNIEGSMVYSSDKIMTLVTCADGGKKRLVINAVLYQEEET